MAKSNNPIVVLNVFCNICEEDGVKGLEYDLKDEVRGDYLNFGICDLCIAKAAIKSGLIEIRK